MESHGKKRENCLECLKEEYKKIQQKHNLPSFEVLNEDFGIEKIELETDYLIREVRKYMADKLANYLRFVETLLNPSNVPIFVFSIIKTMGSEEMNKLKEIYKKLANKEVELVSLDLIFDEKKEVEFVKDTYKLWQEIKEELGGVMEIIKSNLNSKFEVNNKGYFN